MAFSYALIKYDTEKEEPVRDSRGFCIKVPPGETVSVRNECLLPRYLLIDAVVEARCVYL